MHRGNLCGSPVSFSEKAQAPSKLGQEVVDRTPEIRKDGTMKREFVLLLLCLTLCPLAQAGISYTAFSPSGNVGPNDDEGYSLTVGSLATASGFGSVLEGYTVSLTCLSDSEVSPIGLGGLTGALTLTPTGGGGPWIQNFTLSLMSAVVEHEGGTITYIYNFPSSDPLFDSGSGSPDPNGQWSLVINSTGFGDNNTMQGWSLDITAVPEPVNVALGIFGGLFVVGGLCRTQQVRDRIQRWQVGVNQWLDAV
jgi:hypothetical protein